MPELKIKDIVYYARIIPSTGIYEVCELRIRTIEDSWFVGIDKRDKHAYLLNMNDVDKVVFIKRKDALDKVLFAESNKKEYVSNETYYEEY